VTVLWIWFSLLTFATLLLLFLIRPWTNRMTEINQMPQPQ
jgi:threonine/homoserine efflux transporter RhtA